MASGMGSDILLILSNGMQLQEVQDFDTSPLQPALAHTLRMGRIVAEVAVARNVLGYYRTVILILITITS